MTWDEYFINMCKLISTKSKDRSTKVGCIIVGPNHEIRSSGYNGFIRGADDEKEDWHKRPKKYKVTIHAEENAICNAARSGIQLNQCIAYISLPPCSKCAALLVQSGIIKILVIPAKKDWKSIDIWREELSIAEEILEEANVPLIFL